MTPSKFACYCRVRTENKNIDRQLKSNHDHAQPELDADLKDVEIFRDKSTGTGTAREGYRDLVADVDAGNVDVVVDYEISRLARSLQDLNGTVKLVTGSGTEIHFGRDNLRVTGEENPMTRLQVQMLGEFAEWEARVKQMNTREGIAARRQEDGYHHGRPPLWFE